MKFSDNGSNYNQNRIVRAFNHVSEKCHNDMTHRQEIGRMSDSISQEIKTKHQALHLTGRLAYHLEQIQTTYVYIYTIYTNITNPYHMNQDKMNQNGDNTTGDGGANLVLVSDMYPSGIVVLPLEDRFLSRAGHALVIYE